MSHAAGLTPDDDALLIEQRFDRPQRLEVEIDVESAEAMQVGELHELDAQNWVREPTIELGELRILLLDEVLVFRVGPKPIFPGRMMTAPRLLELDEAVRNDVRLPRLVQDTRDHAQAQDVGSRSSIHRNSRSFGIKLPPHGERFGPDSTSFAASAGEIHRPAITRRAAVRRPIRNAST